MRAGRNGSHGSNRVFPFQRSDVLAAERDFARRETIAEELRFNYIGGDLDTYEPWDKVSENVRDRWRRVADQAVRMLRQPPR